MKTTIVALGLALAGCGFTPTDGVTELDTKSIPARRGTVIADGCTLDEWQLEALSSLAARTVLAEVVLDCLVPHADGTITPADESARSSLSELVARLRDIGYRVTLAASFVTDDGYTFDGTQTATELASATWTTAVVTSLASFASSADGIDLDLEQLPPSARPDLTRFVATLATEIRPKKQLGVFLPPSTTSPSDVVGGDAFDVASLGAYTDRFRVMTLDYSSPHVGPTIDSGWAVDAVRFAQSSAGAAALDVAFPLYGNDFTTSGSGGVRPTTYLEALGVASTYGATPQRSPSRELELHYTDDEKNTHELWYDDADSTLVTLGAWTESTLPLSVGVVFYGLGAEDPALWDAIAKATP